MSDLRAKTAASLPVELQSVFNQLVADYQAAARKHAVGRQPWINYNLLADLLRAGWRKESSASDAISNLASPQNQPHL